MIAGVSVGILGITVERLVGIVSIGVEELVGIILGLFLRIIRQMIRDLDYLGDLGLGIFVG